MNEPTRTPGRNDFGRWDVADDPQEGEVAVPLALNNPPLRRLDGRWECDEYPEDDWEQRGYPWGPVVGEHPTPTEAPHEPHPVADWALGEVCTICGLVVYTTRTCGPPAALAARDDEPDEVEKLRTEVHTLLTERVEWAALLARARAILTPWIVGKARVADPVEATYYARALVALADALSTDEPAPAHREGPMQRLVDAVEAQPRVERGKPRQVGWLGSGDGAHEGFHVGWGFCAGHCLPVFVFDQEGTP